MEDTKIFCGIMDNKNNVYIFSSEEDCEQLMEELLNKKNVRRNFLTKNNVRIILMFFAV